MSALAEQGHLTPEGYRCRNPRCTRPGRLCCARPDCTGVHANSRYHEMCALAHDKKRARDDRYYGSNKGFLTRLRKTQMCAAAYAEMEDWLNSGKLDELVTAAQASTNPLAFILRAAAVDVFGSAA